MIVLYLGPRREEIIRIITSGGDLVINGEDKPSALMSSFERADYLVSFGYRHLIGKELLNRFPMKAINLHVSYLPWNRGADPNLWSFLDDTPKGVSIHYLDEGLDTGPVLVQEEVPYKSGDTLRDSYDRLLSSIIELFGRHWPAIRTGRIEATPQPHKGTLHRMREKEEFDKLLVAGWDTPVLDLIGRGKKDA